MGKSPTSKDSEAAASSATLLLYRKSRASNALAWTTPQTFPFVLASTGSSVLAE